MEKGRIIKMKFGDTKKKLLYICPVGKRCSAYMCGHRYTHKYNSCGSIEAYCPGCRIATSKDLKDEKKKETDNKRDNKRNRPGDNIYCVV